jgi:hypothetical protein
MSWEAMAPAFTGEDQPSRDRRASLRTSVRATPNVKEQLHASSFGLAREGASTGGRSLEGHGSKSSAADMVPKAEDKEEDDDEVEEEDDDVAVA